MAAKKKTTGAKLTLTSGATAKKTGTSASMTPVTKLPTAAQQKATYNTRVAQVNAAKPTVTTVTTPAPRPAPFLTPDEQRTWNDEQATIAGQIQALNNALTQALPTLNQNLADAQKQHDVSTNNDNQAMAARGLFQSSIRAADLNDLDATLTTRQNLLNTNYKNFLVNTQGQIDTLNKTLNNDSDYYTQLMAQNAAGADTSGQATTHTVVTPGKPAPALTPAPAPTTGIAANYGKGTSWYQAVQSNPYVNPNANPAPAPVAKMGQPKSTKLPTPKKPTASPLGGR